MKRNISAMHPLRLLVITAFFVLSHYTNAQNVLVQGTSVTITNHPKGALSTCLTSAQLNTVSSLTISGDIDATDFKTIRDLMPSLSVLDIRGCTIQAYHGTGGTWKSWYFPATPVVDYPANTIPMFAFYDKPSISSTLLPESVVCIGVYAYYNTHITNFNFPSSLEKIEDFGLFGCPQLGYGSTITLPAKLTSIGGSAFAICRELTSVVIPTSVERIGNHAFTNCTKLSNIAFTDLANSNLKKIEAYTFSTCPLLKDIELPYKVDSIKEFAFGDDSLNYLKINSSKIVFTSDAFKYTKINRLILNNTNPGNMMCLTNAFPESFYDSTYLQVPVGTMNAYATSSNTGYQWNKFKLIAEGLIPAKFGTITCNMSKPLQVDFNTEVLSLGDLSPLEIGVVYSTSPHPTLSSGIRETRLLNATVSTIGFGVSTLNYSTKYYARVYLYNKNSTSVEGGSIYGPEVSFTTISGVYITGNQGEITGAQPGCLVNERSFTSEQKTAIKVLNISGTLDARDFKVISQEFPLLEVFNLNGNIAAYSGTDGPVSQYFSYPANELPNRAFNVNTKINSISLPASITSIGEAAFWGCSNLAGIVLPASLNRIRASAFYNCTRLGNINLPASLQYIETAAFSQCTGLSGIFSYLTTPINLSGIPDVFKGIPSICVLRVPSGTLASYVNAAQWSNFPEIAEGFVPPTMTLNTGNTYQTSAVLYCTISSLGDWKPIQHGFMISKTSNFNINTAWKVINLGDLTAPGTFSATLEGLTPNTTYYYRSYCMNPGRTNNYNICNGPNLSFTTTPSNSVTFSGTTAIINDATPGCLVGSSVLDANQKIQTTTLSINGTIDARDIKVIRSEMPWIVTLNLSNATIAAYTGTEGTESTASISYPANTLPANAFLSKKTISTVDLPINLKAIDKFAFSQSDISKITIPAGVENIGEESFSNCIRLLFAEIPAGIKSIGNNCFSGDTQLNRINALPATALNIDGSTTVFNSVPATCILRVPVGSSSSYKSTNQWKNFTRIVETFSTPAITTSALTITGTQGVINGATPGCLTVGSFLSSSQKALLTDLTITGSIDARDFRIMRDEMPLLSKIDLKNANIVFYNGLKGTRETDSTTYLDNYIPSYAFHDKSTLTNIVLPSSATAIDIYSFYNCSKLTDCTMSNSLSSILPLAFSNCRNLQNFVMPNSLTTLYDQVFAGCTSLKNITFSTGITSLSSSTFSNCSAITSLTIPDNITSIGTTCFKGCNGLTSITLPASLNSLGDQVFMDCNNLKTINVKNPVAPVISASAFDLSPLSLLTLRVPLTTIASYTANTNWSKIPRIVEGYISPVLLPGSAENVKGTSADILSGIQTLGDAIPTDYGFVYGTSPEPIINYSTVFSLGSNTSNASTFKASLTNLTDGATYYVRPYITIPANSIVSGTVYGNQVSFTALSTKATVNDTVATVTGAVGGCLVGDITLTQTDKNKITDLTVSGKIDARDFKVIRDQMPALKRLNIKNTLIVAYSGSEGTQTGSFDYLKDEMPFNCFLSKTTLENIVLPDSITVLNANAFNGCAKLRSVDMPRYIQRITGSSFSSCSALTSITLPSSLTNIAPYAFYGCTSLKSVTSYLSTPLDLTNSTNCFGLVPVNTCVLKVPTDALTAYTNAAVWKDFKNIGEGFTPATVTYSSPTKYTTSARIYATITNMGDGKPVNCGFIWGKTQNLTLSTASKSSNGVPVINTTYYTDVTSLNPGETIYYRLYTTNPGTSTEAGTTYYPVTSFTTTQYTDNLTSNNISILTDVTPGSISDNTYLNDAQKALVTTLYVSGQLDARDLKAIRDRMPNLYTLNIRNTSIVAYSGTEGPEGASSINYAANYLPAKCFRGTKISSLELPYGLTSLGDSAMSKNYVNSLVLPAGVTSLGNDCFAGNISVYRIYLPAGLSYIGTGCFSNCTTLNYIHNNNPAPATLPGFTEIFSNVNNGNCRVYVPNGSLTAYKNATGWKNFANITEMPALPTNNSTLTLNGSVASLTGATAGCLMQSNALTTEQKNTITELSISGTMDPRDMRIIRDEMPALKILDLSNTTLAAYNGYYGTGMLDSTTYLANQLYYNFMTTKLTLEKFIFPSSVTSSNSSSFAYCAKLDNVDVPALVTTLSGASFNYCINLKSITLHTGLSTFGPNIFFGCKSLKNIALPTTLTTMGIGCFRECISMQSVKLPEGVKTVSTNTFMSCTNLTSVDFPGTVTTLNSSMFQDCNRLKNIIVRSTTPPTTSTSTFALAPVQQMTLRIPKGTITPYLGNTGLKLVPRIVEGFVDPALTTDSVNNVTLTSASAYGNIADLGDGTPLKYGLVWSTSHNPDITLSTKTETSGSVPTGIISANLSNLTSGTTYYVRSYVTSIANSDTAGTVYGNEYSFKTVTDILKTVTGTSVTIGNAVPGSLKAGLTNTDKSTSTSLTITGSIDASDFKVIRDEMPALKSLNIAAAKIVAYTGTNGTLTGNNSYPEKSLPANALLNKTILTDLTLPDTIVNIAAGALYNCTVLRSLTFQTPVTSIGDSAFANCSGLRNFYIHNSTPVNLATIQNVFKGMLLDSCILHIPTDALSAYTAALQWKDFKLIGEGFTTMGYTSINANVYTTSVRVSINTSTYAGDSKPVNYGFIWGKTPDLTLSSPNKSSQGVPTISTYLYNDITGLTPGDTYYYRFYTTNPATKAEAGTFYYPVNSFTTNKVTENSLNSSIVILPNVTPGSLSDNTFLTDAQKSKVSTLVIGGRIDARDIKALRDQMPMLGSVNIKNTVIEAYTGVNGPASNQNTVYPANTLPARAFWGGRISTCELPYGLTAIGDSAFSKLLYSLSLFIPAKVTSIGNGCFAQSKNLYRVALPAGLTSIGTNCFDSCSNLNNLYCYNPAPIDLSASGNVFNQVNKTYCRLYVPKGTIDAYKAASQWNSFTAITEMSEIPASTAVVTVNGTSATLTGATAGCLMQSSTMSYEQKESITDLTITGTLDARDFRIIRDEMPALRSIDMTNVTISEFTGRNGTYPMDSTTYTANQVCYNGFNGKINLETFVMPASGTSLGNFCFYNCVKLKNLKLQNSLMSIGASTFYYCWGLDSIALPNSVTSISNNSFYGCRNLKKVAFPTTLITLGLQAFRDCISLENIEIPEGIKGAPSSGFMGCTSLKSVTFPSTITTIPNGIFSDCNALKTINIRSIVPPTANVSTFNYAPVQQFTLRIPKGALTGYVGNTYFNKIPRIIEGIIPPTVTTDSVTQVQGDSATIHATITSLGDATPLKYGFVWSKEHNPNIISASKTQTFNPINQGAVKATLTGLAPMTTYYVRSYITSVANTDTAGTVYGSEQTFTTGVDIRKQVTDTTGTISKLYQGYLSTTLTSQEKATMTSLTITGSIDARDFKVIRDEMPALRKIILNGAKIVAYTGENGTLAGSNNYPGATIPANAFSGNSKLEFITLPDSATSINDAAFKNCTALNYASLPATITSMGHELFNGCTNLYKLAVHAGTPVDLTSKNTVFGGVNTDSCILQIPANALSAYTTAVQWKDFKNIGEGFINPQFSVITANPSYASCYYYGTIDNLGDSKTFDLFILWGSSPDLTIEKSNKISLGTKTQAASYASVIPGMESGKTYYIRFCLSKPSTTTSAGIVYYPVTTTTTLQNNSDFMNGVAIINNVTPGGLVGDSFISASQKNTLTTLTLTGSIDARDFKAMHDQMPKLSKLNFTNATVVEYNGTEGTRSSKSEHYAANTIPSKAFMNSSIATIEMPSNIIALEDSVFFSNSTYLYGIRIPSGVQSLGDHCFANCIQLQFITTPKTLSHIGKGCFYNCSSIREFTSMTAPAIKLDSSENVFYGLTNTGRTLFVPAGSIESYQNDEQWKTFSTIREIAVATSPATTTIENNIADISNATPGCFMNDSTLTAEHKNTITSIRISGTIDARDFRIIRDEMPNLTFIDLKNTNIAAYNGRLGTYPTDSISYSADRIPCYAFSSKIKLKTVLFPVSANSIDYNAFQLCSALDTINIPSNIVSLGTNAFTNCTKLRSINLPGTMTSIGAGAFTACTRLDSVTLPNGITLLQTSLFKDCISLKNIVLPASLTQVAGTCFWNCASLKEITFPSALTTIMIPRGGNIFRDCNALTRINFKNTIAPSAPSNTFSYYNTAQLTIRVPAGGLNSYVSNSVFSVAPIIEGFIPPVVASDTIDNIGETSATLHGKVLSVGDVTSVGYGFVWSKTSNPTFSTANKKLITGTPPQQATDFSATLSSLETGCTYYVRPFVRIMSNPVEAGIVYGNQMVFTAGIGITVKDTSATISNSYGGALQNPTLVSEEQKQVISLLKITGVIDARDLRVIHDQLPDLRYLDLSGASIAAYTGTEGTAFNTNKTYDANVLPDSAFFGDSIRTVLLPAALQIIGAHAFEQSTLERISIPASVQQILPGAFAGCNNLTNISIQVTHPIDLSATPDIFQGVDFSKCILRVPNDCLQAYKDAPVWNQFQLIAEGSRQPSFRIVQTHESGSQLMVTAEITDFGDFKLNTIGVVAGENSTPTMFNNDFKNVTTPPQSTGTFKIELNNLKPGTNYTMRLFAMTKATTDEAAVVYSDVYNYGTQKAELGITVAPSVLTSKIYDGNSLAFIANPGALSGIRSEDQSKIQITAVASYSNETAGLNKTIRITYILSGPGSERYKAPNDVIIENAVINKRLSLKALLEGYWNPVTGKMNKCQEWDNDLQVLSDKFQGDIVDTLTVELHNTKYSEISYSINGLQIHEDGRITSDGQNAIAVPPILAGSYYITIKNRNHLETTSSTLLTFNNYTVDYDFSDSDTKAYESDLSFKPTKHLGSAWTIYAGDVTNDNNKQIDEYDLYSIFANRSAIQNNYGYKIYDVNGDGDINDMDIYLMFENRSKFFYHNE